MPRCETSDPSRLEPTITATSVCIESVSSRAVALVATGIVGAFLLTTGDLLSTLINICQMQQAGSEKVQLGCCNLLPRSQTHF